MLEYTGFLLYILCMKERVVYNLIEYIMGNDIYDEDNEYYIHHIINPDRFAPHYPAFLWKYIATALNLSSLDLYLIQALKNSYKVEDFYSCFILKEAILRNFEITTKQVEDTGSTLIRELANGFEFYEIFSEFEGDAKVLSELWNKYGIPSSRDVLSGVQEMSNEIHSFSLERMRDELFGSLDSDYTHPAIIVDRLTCYLRIVA